MQQNNTINDLAALENERKKIIKKEYTIIIIAILIGIGFSSYFNDVELTFIPLLPGAILSIILTHSQRKNFVKTYKHLIIFEIFKKNFDNVKFLPENGLSYDIFQELDVIKKPDRYSSNDYITANYKNIPFIAADVHFEKESKDKDGHSHYYTTFQGQWYIFDFNKSFISDVQIIDSHFFYSTKSKIFKKDFNDIQLEDIEFNKLFNTYAKKDIDAFYLITPNLIEKIKHIKKNTKGQLILCFNNNKLHIGVNNRRNSFEPNMSKTINIDDIEYKTLREIKDIIQFIDYLDLDNELFRKEV